MLRKNEVTGVAVVPDADRNLLFSFFSLLSLYQRCHRSAGAAEGQPRSRKAERKPTLQPHFFSSTIEGRKRGKKLQNQFLLNVTCYR
jgi:hypothetical protein